jgi:hypothetical protein
VSVPKERKENLGNREEVGVKDKQKLKSTWSFRTSRLKKTKKATDEMRCLCLNIVVDPWDTWGTGHRIKRYRNHLITDTRSPGNSSTSWDTDQVTLAGRLKTMEGPTKQLSFHGTTPSQEGSPGPPGACPVALQLSLHVWAKLSMSSCFSSQPTKKEREAKDSGAAAPVITETQPITIAARRPGKVVRPLQKLCGRKKRQS